MNAQLSRTLAVAGLACLATLAPVAAAPEAGSVARAAKAGDESALRTLLREGGDVNAAEGDGMTALHWAATQGDAGMLELLLRAGANHRATTRLGAYTPLHLASRSGATPAVQALLNAGADAAARTSAGATALILAARGGDVEIARGLIAKGAEVNAVETANKQTALMVAAAFDRAPLVELLLANGADPALASNVTDLAALTAPSEPDRQAIAAATGERRAEQASERKVDVPGLTRPFRYNELIGAHGGYTALHFAARQGSIAAARALVKGGAAIDAPSPGDRTTPLLMAIVNGHFDLAADLLNSGADPALTNSAGVSPLYAVINVQWAPKAAYPQPRAYLQQQTSYLELISALLAKGADPNARVNRKVWFASYNFDQSSVDEIGATPFWRAAYASDVDAMKMLVAAGADPTIATVKPMERRPPGEGPAPGPDRSGMPTVPVGAAGVTPLQAAAGVGYGQGFAGNSHRFAPGGMLAAVKYLVEELHVDVNARDHDGNTAMHHAAARGDNEMIEFLVAHGAVATYINRSGQSTADMANGPVQRIQPFPETIALLEKLGAKNHNRCVSC